MEKAVLGRPGPKVGLGCWQLGGGDWGDITDEAAQATLRAAVDSGADVLDTADVYGNGRSEELIGRFLRGMSSRPQVATKFGRLRAEGFRAVTQEFVRDAARASLRRLGVEALDLLQIHCLPRGLLEQGEIFEWLRALRKDGLIRRFGASVETMDEARVCLRQEGLFSLQIIFNALRQKPLDALFEEAKQRQVALIVRLPLAGGLLGGKYTLATRFDPGDHRTFNRDGAAFYVGETFSGLPFEKGVALADALKKKLPPGMMLPQLALRYCLDFDAVTVVIPGARNADQARANAAAEALPRLPPALHAQLRAFYAAEVAPHIRGDI